MSCTSSTGLAASTTGMISRISTATGSELLRYNAGTCLEVNWHPDGKRLALDAHDNTVTIVDAESGAQLVQRPMGTAAWCACWSPNGKVLVAVLGDGSIAWLDPETVEERQRLPAAGDQGHSDGVAHLAWSPDGRWLASAAYDGIACVWDGATGRLQRKLERHKGDVNCVDWSPDGDVLA